MTTCTRGCTRWQRHTPTCPVEDRNDTAWTALPADDPRRNLITDDTPDDQLRELGVTRNRWGGLEHQITCRGCKPRDATHGTLCEPCHLRLTAALDGSTHDHTWTPAEGSTAWAYWWLAADREPRQQAAGLDKVMGSRTPPAALALHIHDLRTEIATALGQWVAATALQFGLTGPDWWRTRIDHNHRRRDDHHQALVPQTQAEVTDAQRWLHGWLPRIEEHADLVTSIYTAALIPGPDRGGIIPRVAALAPWQATPKALRGIPCPSCERDALAIYDGSSNVVCRRCQAVYGWERYNVWAAMIEEERNGERIAS